LLFVVSYASPKIFVEVVVVELESPPLPGQAVNKTDTASAVKILDGVFMDRPC